MPQSTWCFLGSGCPVALAVGAGPAAVVGEGEISAARRGAAAPGCAFDAAWALRPGDVEGAGCALIAMLGSGSGGGGANEASGAALAAGAEAVASGAIPALGVGTGPTPAACVGPVRAIDAIA